MALRSCSPTSSCRRRRTTGARLAINFMGKVLLPCRWCDGKTRCALRQYGSGHLAPIVIDVVEKSLEPIVGGYPRGEPGEGAVEDEHFFCLTSAFSFTMRWPTLLTSGQITGHPHGL